MKSALIESIKMPKNTIIDPCSIATLSTAKNLECLTLRDAIFKDFKLSDLKIQNSLDIKYIDLQGGQGLKILPVFNASLGAFPVPLSWLGLTQLGILNFRSNGFSASQVDNLINGLSHVANAGLGSAATIKKIYLDGNNANPTPLSSGALTTLNALGWTVIHSDMTLSEPLEDNPCCAGDCVECGPTAVTPKPTYPLNLATNLPDNTDTTVDVAVPGILASKSYVLNVTGIPDGLSVILHSHMDGALKVFIVNNTGMIFNTNISMILAEV
jgi:hypothetical protein